MDAIPRPERGANVLQIRFLGDPSAAFTKALELDFDGTAIFGGPRGKRYALVVENGRVAAAYVEPDNIGTSGKSPFHRSVMRVRANWGSVSMAENVLG